MNLETILALLRHKSNYPDRSVIDNVWSQEQFLRQLIVTLELSHELTPGVNFAEPLLSSSDPYLIKIGLQIFRYCVWKDKTLARYWIDKYNLRFVNHAHPRVRQSNLWLLKSCVWIDNFLAPDLAELAIKSLYDLDMPVRRVAMWLLTDCIINNEAQFDLSSDHAFNYLVPEENEGMLQFFHFCFIMPLWRRYPIQRFVNLLKTKATSLKYRGLLCRVQSFENHRLMLEDDPQAQKVALGNFYNRFKSQPDIAQIFKEPYSSESIHILAKYFEKAETFSLKMNILWGFRELLWGNPSLGIDIFNILSAHVLDIDGDISRNILFVINDCLLLHPDSLGSRIPSLLDMVFENIDNDGSQIVALALLTLRNPLPIKSLAKLGGGKVVSDRPE